MAAGAGGQGGMLWLADQEAYETGDDVEHSNLSVMFNNGIYPVHSLCGN